MLGILKKIHEALPNTRKITRGDFNMILNISMKKGGLRILDKDVEAFIEAIDQMDMVDVEIHNDIFT